MKIIQIIPGFGGAFYCGNCLRDSALVQSLRREGHDAMTLPMYLPLTINGQTRFEGIPVFYGAVNIYLKQNYPLFRKMPGWLERFFNSGPVLRFAARKAGSTRAEGLEAMTESMLLGSHGNQREELDQLVCFLQQEKPDIVHLSNALLLGLAKQIREEAGVPVVYSLQDEDVWVDAMNEPHRSRIWELMAERVRDVDAFIAVSHFYADIMKEKMQIPDTKMNVVHIGVNPEAYEPLSPESKTPAVGFLSRMHEENGFGILVDAFIELKRNPSYKDLRLYATGGMTGDDRRFFTRQMKKLKANNLTGDVFIQHDFRQESLKDFFRNVSILSVPVLKGEAFGLYQLEALASGIPLVQPEVGAFPEIINATGGGVTYHPNTSSMLASALADTLEDKEKLSKLSASGVAAIATSFNCRNFARNMVNVYNKILENNK